MKAKIRVRVQHKHMGINLFSMYLSYKVVLIRIWFSGFNTIVSMKTYLIKYRVLIVRTKNYLRIFL
jgi:hypothetical protein